MQMVLNYTLLQYYLTKVDPRSLLLVNFHFQILMDSHSVLPFYNISFVHCFSSFHFVLNKFPSNRKNKIVAFSRQKSAHFIAFLLEGSKKIGSQQGKCPNDLCQNWEESQRHRAAAAAAAAAWPWRWRRERENAKGNQHL